LGERERMREREADGVVEDLSCTVEDFRVCDEWLKLKKSTRSSVVEWKKSENAT
jgi:hypothetical protein